MKNSESVFTKIKRWLKNLDCVEIIIIAFVLAGLTVAIPTIFEAHKDCVRLKQENLCLLYHYKDKSTYHEYQSYRKYEDSNLCVVDVSLATTHKINCTPRINKIIKINKDYEGCISEVRRIYK